MSASQKLNQSSRSFNFNTIRISQDGRETSNQNYQERPKMEKRSKRYKFGDNGDSTPQPSSKQSPIAILENSSNKLQIKSNEKNKVEVVSKHELVEEDKQDRRLGMQTTDTVMVQENPFDNHAVRIQKQQSEVKPTLLADQLVESFLTNSFDSFYQNLKQKKVSLSNLKEYEEVTSFFELYRLLFNQFSRKNLLQYPYLNTKLVEKVGAWTTSSIKTFKKTNPLLSFSKVSQPLDHFLSEKTSQYIETLLSQKRFSEALAISNLTDKVVQSKPLLEFLEFKKEFNILRSQKISILTKTSWLFQLALATNYFPPSRQKQYGRQIYNRYRSSKSNILPCALTLLGLYCCQDYQTIQEHILMTIQDDQDMKYIQYFQLFCILREYKNQCPKAYKQVRSCLLKKIVDPKLGIQLILFFQEPQSNNIKYFLKSYLCEKKSDQTIIQLIYTIEKMFSISQKNPCLNILSEWSISQTLLNYFAQQKYSQFLSEFIANYQILSHSLIVQFQQLLDKTVECISSFKMACNYKKNKKIQYYRLLDELETKLKRFDFQTLDCRTFSDHSSYLNLIQSWKCFAELKLGAFTLNDPIKLDRLQFLVENLKEKQFTDDDKMHLDKTLKYFYQKIRQALNSKDGYIFLNKICTVQQKQVKENMSSTLKQLLHDSGKSISEQESSSTGFKLLNITNYEKTLLRKMIILLEIN